MTVKTQSSVFSTPTTLVDITPTIVTALQEQQGVWGEYEQICLVLVDGMGQEQLQEYRGHIPFLRRELGRSIETVIPSTTAAAITSLLTGKTPVETKILGYEMRLAQGPTSMIKFGGGPDSYALAAKYQPAATIFEQLGYGVAATNPRFANSGLSGAALRGSETRGGKELGQRVDAALAALAAGERFVYLYTEDVDHAGHHAGPGSDPWLAALENTDHELARLARQLPQGCLLIITADHGMVHAEESLDIAELAWADEVAEIAGEARAIHLFATAARGREYVDEAALEQGYALFNRHAEELSYWGKVTGREEIARQWELPVNDIRVPDILVQSLGAKKIIDARFRSPSAMRMQGEHGSITKTEVTVPFLLLG